MNFFLIVSQLINESNFFEFDGSIIEKIIEIRDNICDK